MADKSTLYRGEISLSDSDKNHFETLELSVAQHPSETRQRVVARLLAYALSYQENLQLGKGLCDGDMPDIYAQTPGEKMELWVDIGEPTFERMKGACRKANQVNLFLYSKHPWRWQDQHLAKLDDFDNLTITLLPEALLEQLSEMLARNFRWTAMVNDGIAHIYPEESDSPLPEISLADIKC